MRANALILSFVVLSHCSPLSGPPARSMGSSVMTAATAHSVTYYYFFRPNEAYQ